MRNIGGKIGFEKFQDALIATFKLKRIEFEYFNPQSKTWIKHSSNTTPNLTDIKYMRWSHARRKRSLCRDINVPIVKKNVDIVLFNEFEPDLKKTSQLKTFRENPAHYLALGELKGGIDPAGADEHWKSANTALDRVKKSFSLNGHNPDTFFIGAAIETSMADEIFQQCSRGELSDAANLNNNKQLAQLCYWIVGL